MNLKELRQLLDRLEANNYATDDTEIEVFGVGHGLPLKLTGDFSRAPAEENINQPVLLHSRVDEPANA
jgi:hypothetical protein